MVVQLVFVQAMPCCILVANASLEDLDVERELDAEQEVLDNRGLRMFSRLCAGGNLYHVTRLRTSPHKFQCGLLKILKASLCCTEVWTPGTVKALPW